MRSDIERYKRQARRIELAGIDFAAFNDQPLPVGVLRCLRYMHDVEHHTICYLRDLLVTPAHRDPAVTTFLTLWSYEELWHGEAIGQVLAAHDEVAGSRRIGPLRRRPEVAFMVTSLFGDDAGRAAVRRIDQQVDRLPGLSGLHLVERARDRYMATVVDGSPTTRPSAAAATTQHHTGNPMEGQAEAHEAAA